MDQVRSHLPSIISVETELPRNRIALSFLLSIWMVCSKKSLRKTHILKVLEYLQLGPLPFTVVMYPLYCFCIYFFRTRTDITITSPRM